MHDLRIQTIKAVRLQQHKRHWPYIRNPGFILFNVVRMALFFLFCLHSKCLWTLKFNWIWFCFDSRTLMTHLTIFAKQKGVHTVFCHPLCFLKLFQIIPFAPASNHVRYPHALIGCSGWHGRNTFAKFFTKTAHWIAHVTRHESHVTLLVLTTSINTCLHVPKVTKFGKVPGFYSTT